MELVSKKFIFSENNMQVIQEILLKYPIDRKKSAIMPLLTLAQKQNNNYLSRDCIETVAEILKLPVMQVMEVANFYSMYNLVPVGKYHFQMCNSVSCLIVGSEKLYDFLKTITGVSEGNISKDGKFSVKKVECLGACVNAVALKMNDIFIDDISEDSLIDIVEKLKQDLPIIVDKIIKKIN